MTLQGGKIKISNRLWKARKRRGLGQKQVAFLIGKTIGEVSRYERGVRPLKL
jgi:transcriptional regulator with XRE-family HTH domain